LAGTVARGCGELAIWPLGRIDTGGRKRVCADVQAASSRSAATGTLAKIEQRISTSVPGQPPMRCTRVDGKWVVCVCVILISELGGCHGRERGLLVVNRGYHR